MPEVEEVGDTKVMRRMRWVARIWGTVVVALARLVFSGYAWSWVTTGEADPQAAEDILPLRIGLRA
jgi:hypothetical protein